MRDGYDVMQVCLNGHVINARFRSRPEKNRTYCPDCGAKTITSCQECNEEITGESTAPSSFVVLGYTDPAPDYCDECGKPHPWTQSKLEAFRELVGSTSLKQDKKKVLSDGITHIISDTPKTKLICAQFVGIISKESPLRSALLDIATKQAKEFLEKWASAPQT